MLPLLFKIGSVPIHTYGVMIALGFVFGTLLNRRLAAKAGLPPELIVDASFWGMMTGFLGTRLLYVITRLPTFWSDPLAVFRIWEGGFVFWGGPIIAIPWGIWYFRKNGLPFWKTADIVVCGLVLGHSIGRLGCLAAGCCYGRPTITGWGIVNRTDLVEPVLRGIALHPVQLYEATGLVILLFGLLSVFRRKVFDGQVCITYFMTYPILRSVIELFRGDIIRGFVIDGILSTSQFISILVFATAALVLRHRLKKVVNEVGIG